MTTKTKDKVLVSRVPGLIEKKEWDLKTFQAHCMLAGLSDFTAARLANGDTNFTLGTMVDVCGVLGVDSIDDLVYIKNDQ